MSGCGAASTKSSGGTVAGRAAVPLYLAAALPTGRVRQKKLGDTGRVNAFDLERETAWPQERFRRTSHGCGSAGSSYHMSPPGSGVPVDGTRLGSSPSISIVR